MTAERRAEAQKAGEAFHLALAYIGVASVEESFDLWATLPEDAAQDAVEQWLAAMSGVTSARRQESRDLAIAYYRLARALHTGRTVANPWDPDEGSVTLGTLRADFADLVEDAQGQAPRSERGRDVIDGDEADAPEAGRPDDTEAVEVDRFKGLLEDQRRADEWAEKAQREFLIVNLAHYRAKAARARSGKDLQQARLDAAVVSAGSAQKGTLDGARSTLHSTESRDRLAIGYVRVSRTGTPCGFCAMLISRGIEFKFRAAASAERRSSDGEEYHPGCQCYAEPVFSEEQYAADSRFALNRKYRELWPKVTNGLGGRDALNAWRRYIERGQYETDEQDGSAQAA